jgi:uncharacterized protein YwgA
VTSHDRTSRIAGVASLVTELQTRGVRVRGRKALQKLLLFSQDLGWPTQFQFRLHLFGPYSDEVDAVTDLLEADGVLHRTSQGDLETSEVGAPVAASFVPSTTSRRAAARVANLFRDDDPMTLELLATIKYMWDTEAIVARSVAPSTVVRRVARYKGKKFSEQQIRAGLQRLRRARLLH